MPPRHHACLVRPPPSALITPSTVFRDISRTSHWKRTPKELRSTLAQVFSGHKTKARQSRPPVGVELFRALQRQTPEKARNNSTPSSARHQKRRGIIPRLRVPDAWCSDSSYWPLILEPNQRPSVIARNESPSDAAISLAPDSLRREIAPLRSQGRYRDQLRGLLDVFWGGC
jgi:hypothetical protein